MNQEKKEAINLLKTSKGQIEGIIKMIEDGRYCVDISTQILSAIGLLEKANLKILDQHLRNCVRTAILEGEEEGDEKIDEIIKVIDKYVK
jgi:DNA-binding FrmR family transcriptional regulator